MFVHTAVNPRHGPLPAAPRERPPSPRVVTETRVMSKFSTALLLALSLAPAACDEPDDKTVEGDVTGQIGDIAASESGSTDTTDTTGDEDSTGTTDGDDDPPGCINGLPPTGGPAGTLGDKC
jgi:hypothetical protein